MAPFSSHGWRRVSVEFLMFVSVAWPAWAQVPRQSQQSPRNQAYQVPAGTIHVQSPLVVLPVTVTDRSGNFVLSLKQSDFRVLDDGTQQRVRSFSIRMQPVAAVIVIQTDEGVEPLLDAIHPLGVLFSNLLLGPAGEAAVINYADKARLIQDFSGDPATLEKSLRTITASGGKARMDDALVRAISMLRNQTKAKRRVVIAFSDGFDSGSKASPLEVIRDATAGGVSIYGLRFAPAYEIWKQNDSGPTLNPNLNTPNYGAISGNPSEAMAGSSGGGDLLAPAVMAVELGRAPLRRNALQQYAEFTGGVVYKHWKARAVQDQLQKIAVQMNSEYTLTYVPNTLGKAGFHPVLVEVSKAGLKVRTRAGYFYSPAAR